MHQRSILYHVFVVEKKGDIIISVRYDADEMQTVVKIQRSRTILWEMHTPRVNARSA